MQDNKDKIYRYDFKVPKKANKDTVKTIKDVYENYCRLLTNRLTVLLRNSCKFNVESVEEVVFSEYMEHLDEYASMGVAELSIEDNKSEYKMLFDVSRCLLIESIDRLLGGGGSYSSICHNKEYTDIERSMIKYLYGQVIPIMDMAWQSTLNLKTEFTRTENKFRLGQYIGYSDNVLIIKIKSEINNIEGYINICINMGFVNELTESMASHIKRSIEKEIDTEKRESILGKIQNSDLIVTGVLDKTRLTLRELTEIKEGDLIILDKELKDPVTLCVEGEEWFKGKLGVRNNKSSIKITKNIKGELI